MSYKSDRLSKSISQLQDYIASKGAVHPVLKDTRESAVKLADALSSGKLRINVISSTAEWAQAVSKSLDQNPDTSTLFAAAAKESPWPASEAQAETPPTLILQNPTASRTGQSKYELSAEAPLIVGRDPKRATMLIADRISMVSGSHATFKPVEGLRPSDRRADWQVCDNSSSNGTFVNGQRIQGCHTLQSDDRIVLGGATPDEKMAEFVFVHHSVDHSAVKKLYQEIADCDVLCVVIGRARLNSNATRELIEKFNSGWLSKIYLLVVEPAVTDDSAVASNILTESLKTAPPLEIISLPCAPERAPEGMPVEAKAALDKLASALVALIGKKSEDILVNRMTLQFNTLVANIDQVLVEEEETLKGQFERESQMLNGIGVEQLKDRMKKLLDDAKSSKDSFFSQARIDLNRAKADALDPMVKNGIPGRIQLFTNGMTAIAADKGKGNYIRLALPDQPEARSVDPASLHFCREQLGEWSRKEWNRALNEYGGGGISGLIKRIESSMTITASPVSIEAINQPVRQPNLTRGLDESIIGVKTEEKLEQDGFASYFWTKFRSGWMAFGSVLTIGTSLALSFVSAEASGNPSGGAASRPARGLQGMVQQFPFLKYLIVPVLIGFLIYLMRDYRVSRQHAIEELGEKLKKDLCNHYQSFAKDRVGRLTEEMLLTLDSEDRRLREALGQVEGQLSRQVTDIRTKLDDIKARRQLAAQERGKLNQLRV